MKRIALVAAMALMLTTQVSASPWVKSIATAQKNAKEKNQLILVDLFAQWCGWCHRFEAEVFPSMVFQNATEDLVLLRLDTEDGGEGSKFARQYGVTSLPTFLLLSPDLSIAGIMRGYAPPNDFVRMLKDTREKYTDFQKRVKDESSIAKDYQKRLDLAREFMTRQSYAQAEPRFKKLVTEKDVTPAVRDQAYYELAVAYTLQKKYGDGLKTVMKLTSLSKTGEPVERARLLAGQIYYEQGNFLSAANELRAFKAAYPNSPLIRNVDAVLPEVERRLAASK
ncbi:MAG TPA: thioredoxin fold domain-containing protein [Thermoanaerobaculia bacterium]|nr:thioredoxin fold domain-containing protein [Thermoanaerobaculia bacterium]